MRAPTSQHPRPFAGEELWPRVPAKSIKKTVLYYAVNANCHCMARPADSLHQGEGVHAPPVQAPDLLVRWHPLQPCIRLTC